MKRKILATFIAAVIMAGILAGCGSPEGEADTAQSVDTAREEETAEPESEPEEAAAGTENAAVKSEESYTLAFWYGAADDLLREQYTDAIARFNEMYPNVTVEETSLDSDAYKTKLKTVMGADATGLPDVFMNYGGAGLQSYVEYGLVMDITDLLAPYRDEYYDFEFGISTFDEKIYGMAHGLAPAAVFYNKEIFEEVKAEIPVTWEELDEVCAKVKDAGYVPFALGNKNKWPGLLEYCMLAINLGGEELSLNLTNRTIGFDNEVLVEAGNRILDFSEKGYYPEGCNGIDHNVGGSRMMFYNETAAMLIQTNGFLSNCASEDPDFRNRVGIFQYPSCDDSKSGGVLAGGSVFSISSQCEHPEAAMELLHCITDATFSQQYVDAGGFFTGAKDVEITDDLQRQQFETLMDAKWTQNFYDQAFVTEVGEAFKDNTQALYGGTITAEDAAANIEKIAEECYGAVK